MKFSKFSFKASFLPKGKKMSTKSYKNVVVIGIGSFATKVATKVWENSDSFESLALAFVGVALDKDACKVNGLEENKNSLSNAPFFEAWWDEEIKGLPRTGQELIRKADYVLILSTGQTMCCQAAIKFLEQLKKRGISSTVLTTKYFGLNFIHATQGHPIEVKSKVYKRMAMDQMKDFDKRFVREDSTNKQRIEHEEWKWLSLVEGALNAMCFTKGCPSGSNLFEDIFSDYGPFWFCCGSVSGVDRAGLVIDQVLTEIVNNNIFMSERRKTFLCLKAEELSEEEIRAITEEIKLDFISSDCIVSIVKSKGNGSALTFSLFYG